METSCSRSAISVHQQLYPDCYGTPEMIGKIGTDILDNKCSWNINHAISVATPEQRAVLDANYGRKDAQTEAAVKEIFAAPDVDVAGAFHKYEAESYTRLNALIDALPEGQGALPDDTGGIKREVCRSFLAKVYKRSK